MGEPIFPDPAVSEPAADEPVLVVLAPAPVRPRWRQRLPVLVTAAVVLVGAAGAGAYLAARISPAPPLAAFPPLTGTAAPTPTVAPIVTPEPAPTPAPTPYVPPSYAMNGPGTYLYAGGGSAVFGAAGSLRTYRVAIETGIPVSADEFAAVVDATLGDQRSWIAGNNLRLQRVPGDAAASFTVRLVTPGTASKLCAAVGLGIYWHGEPYTSCQAGQQAVINLSRYLKAIPDYGAPLAAYQQYAINHEVGHVLGHDHEKCPGTGRPAPVMQQQTFGLLGCVANSWPYLDGHRYSGPPGTVVPN